MYGSLTRWRKEIRTAIKLSIVKTFFLLYLFKTRRTESNEGSLSSLGRRHHPFPCIQRHGPKETPNTKGASARWSPRLPRTHPSPGTGSETRTVPTNCKRVTPPLFYSWLYHEMGLRSCSDISKNSKSQEFSLGRMVPLCFGKSIGEDIFLFTHGIPYRQSMSSRNVYKVRSCSENPSICNLLFWVNRWPFPYKMFSSYSKRHIPSTLDICKAVKYYLEEKVPKEGASLDKSPFCYYHRKSLPMTC